LETPAEKPISDMTEEEFEKWLVENDTVVKKRDEDRIADFFERKREYRNARDRAQSKKNGGEGRRRIRPRED
jgi:hypothetical protein